MMPFVILWRVFFFNFIALSWSWNESLSWKECMEWKNEAAYFIIVEIDETIITIRSASERDTNIFFLHGKSASAKMSSSAQVDFESFSFFSFSMGRCCYGSLHFTRDYEALIVKINYAIRHTHTQAQHSNRQFLMFILCVFVFVCIIFFPSVLGKQSNKMA